MLGVGDMVSTTPSENPSWKDQIMRFAPVAAALSRLFAVQASVGTAEELTPDPRAALDDRSPVRSTFGAQRMGIIGNRDAGGNGHADCFGLHGPT